MELHARKAPQISFYNHKPESVSLYEAVIDGFSRTNKCLPPKFFYDERGSHLFDEICNQPEYYLPDVERRLLINNRHHIASLVGKGRVVVEPGAGNLAKIRLLLDQLKPDAYVPMDISGDYLESSCRELAEDSPELEIHGVCVDFTHSMPLPKMLSDAQLLVFFPGSSLGNFHRDEARDFLTMVRDTLGRDGMLLIGVDTKKPATILNAAYNDAAGITAEFNLNLLHRIQNELDTDLDMNNFDHRAFYNKNKGRIEMHLVSQREHHIHVDGHAFHFKSGESVHTECSYKYSPEEFIALAAEAGMVPVHHWLAEGELFGMYLLRSI
jgi:dimethylhistidine N-methyltransferase